jgi:hypothetical protein
MRSAVRGVGRSVLVLVVAASCAGPAESGGVDVIDAVPGPTPATTPATMPATTPAPTPAPTPGSVDPSTTAPATVAPVDSPGDPAALARSLVAALAADDLAGRDNGTAGSAAARDLLVEELSRVAEPPAGLGGYLQPFDAGVNVLGLVPGTDLADEYVIVGGHYDHLGELGCIGREAEDSICNGAADNASGVAVAVAVAAALADAAPRRSVLVALWDAEEDGLLGSRHYVTDPVVPLDRTVAYVNLDILGSDLLPSLDRWMLVIGAETGGPALTAAVDDAAGGLRLVHLGEVVAAGRSDHAPFTAARVPIAFLTDFTNGCYHTVDDELAALDLGKLDAQVGLVGRLVTTLATVDDPPAFEPDADPLDFDDVATLLAMFEDGRGDLDLLGPRRSEVETVITTLEEVVAAGVAAFGPDDVATVLGGLATVVDVLDSGWCPGSGRAV